MSYAETYSLKNEELRTMLRGTLRYNDTIPRSLLQSVGTLTTLLDTPVLHL